MFFDIYEIPIQAFLYFINGKFINFQSSSPQRIFQDIYTQNIFQNTSKHPQLFSKQNGGYTFQIFRKNKKFRFSDMKNMFPG